MGEASQRRSGQIDGCHPACPRPSGIYIRFQQALHRLGRVTDAAADYYWQAFESVRRALDLPKLYWPSEGVAGEGEATTVSIELFGNRFTPMCQMLRVRAKLIDLQDESGDLLMGNPWGAAAGRSVPEVARACDAYQRFADLVAEPLEAIDTAILEVLGWTGRASVPLSVLREAYDFPEVPEALED